MLTKIDQLSARIRLRLKRKRDFDACFKHPDGNTLTPAAGGVLRALAQFCTPYRSTVRTSMGGAIDPLAMARAEGRREAFLYIQQQLRVTDDEILDITEEARL